MSSLTQNKGEKPRFSVITVCFNSVETIGRCLNSVSRQIGVPIEHIIIDGGSTDGTLDIIYNYLKGYDDVTLVSESDSGIYDAMNKGINIANGDYISILNSDDYYANNSVLFEIYCIFQKHNELDAVLTDIEFVDLKGNLKRKVNSKYFSPHRLSYGWMPPHPGMFLTSNVYQRYGMFRTDMKIAADYEYCVRIFGKGNASFLSKSITSVYMQQGGVSTRGLKSTLIITREIIRSCTINEFPVNVFFVFLRLPIKAFLSLFDRISKFIQISI